MGGAFLLSDAIRPLAHGLDAVAEPEGVQGKIEAKLFHFQEEFSEK